jgi:sialate O-acetylesterase
VLAGGFLLSESHAKVELAPLFCDHAVLQRDRPVPVWGVAEPDEKVTVSFHGASVETVAGADRRWSVMLGPLAVSGDGADLVVAGKNTLTVHDIVVGDVWLCSGQSNMGRMVGQSINSDHEAASAKFPLIRVLSVENTLADLPATTVVTSGWKVTPPETVAHFTAVGYFFARDLYRKLGIPIGIVHSSFGGTRIEAWMSPTALAGDPAFAGIVPDLKKRNIMHYTERKARFDAALAAWETDEAKAKAAGDAADRIFRKEHARPSAPMTPQQGPSVLFNGMINPLAPYAFRGIVWYQGESNVWRASEYHRLFTALITSSRALFGKNDLPFYWVQLANFETNTNWAWLREAQTQTLALPHTGQAITIDIGEPGDIHPRNKQEVGRRLALIARAHDYGETIEFSGPVFQSAQREADTLRVRFTHAEGGLVVRGDGVKSLEIAGEDRVFHPATARVGGRELVGSSPEVKEPVAVRYAWRSAPVANLYNAAELPAGPFRTDSW